MMRRPRDCSRTARNRNSFSFEVVLLPSRADFWGSNFCAIKACWKCGWQKVSTFFWVEHFSSLEIDAAGAVIFCLLLSKWHSIRVKNRYLRFRRFVLMIAVYKSCQPKWVKQCCLILSSDLSFWYFAVECPMLFLIADQFSNINKEIAQRSS